jgi:hypothetical protein
MRILGLVFGLLATLSMAAAALTYVPGYVGQHRIYVRDWRNPSTARTPAGDPDPHLQRYYSESEGWTYYTLPRSAYR